MNIDDDGLEQFGEICCLPLLLVEISDAAEEDEALELDETDDDEDDNEEEPICFSYRFAIGG